jgi:hypothetical protein
MTDDTAPSTSSTPSSSSSTPSSPSSSTPSSSTPSSSTPATLSQAVTQALASSGAMASRAVAGAARAAPASTAAVVVGAAQFVPLPLVDDWIASFSRQQLARAVVRRHGRTFRVRELRALTDDGSLWTLPFRVVKGLVLAPVKKLLRPLVPFWIARDVALVVGRTFALSHVLDRHLALGGFRDDDDRSARHAEAQRVRRAFDVAWRGVDQRLVRAAIGALMKKARPGVAVDDAAVRDFYGALDERFDRALAELPVR